VLNDEISLAASLRRRGDAALAVPVLERVCATLAPREQDPEIGDYYRVALNNLAMSLRDVDRLDEARAALSKCLALLDALVTPDDFELVERARALDNLAVLLLAIGDAVKAESFARRALGEWTQLVGEAAADTAIARSNVGASLLRQRRLGEARPALERAHGDLASALGAAHPVVAGSLALLAELALAERDVLGAVEHAQRSLDVSAAAELGVDHPDVRSAEEILEAANSQLS
jgi:tetratricopeptide (TPR) repeat protein